MITTHYKSITTTVSFLILFIFHTTTAHSEFYEYTDKNGVKCYTDDSSRIPDKARIKARTHSERYDGLSEAERQERMNETHESIAEIKKKQSEDSKNHEKWARKTEREERDAKWAEKERLREEEKKKKDEEERKKKEERLKKRDNTETRGSFIRFRR